MAAFLRFDASQHTRVCIHYVFTTAMRRVVQHLQVDRVYKQDSKSESHHLLYSHVPRSSSKDNDMTSFPLGHTFTLVGSSLHSMKVAVKIERDND